MSFQTPPTLARILTLISLSLVLFLSACSGANASQVDVNQQNELLSAKQSAFTDGQVAPKAAAPAAQALPGINQANPADAQAVALEGAAAQPQQAQSLNPSAPVDAAPVVSGPAQAASVDASLPVEPRIGARAPQFTLKTLDGQTLTMDSLVGHPVVISYWATWCIPCQQELPILQKLYQEYSNSGLVVLTVNAIDQDSVDKVQSMLAEKGMNLPVLLDEGSSFANDYQAMFFPTTFYIDPNGVIRFIKLGDSTEHDLRTTVDSLMRGDL